MAHIIPAIIPKNLDHLKGLLSLVKGVAPVVQIDIVDGAFVPFTSWPYISNGQEELNNFAMEEEGFPFWQDFSFEADLMIIDPEREVEKYARAGFSRVIVHIEAVKDMRFIIDSLRALDTEIGIAIGVDTPLERLEPFIAEVDLIQCMGISQIGKQGENLNPKVFEKIRTLRDAFPETIISIDGGVRESYIDELKDAGVHRIVSGSAIFGATNPKEAFLSLEETAI